MQMMNGCNILIWCIMSLHLSTSQVGSTLCEGPGYYAHPLDCTKFVRCIVDSYGLLFGQVKECAFGSHWNQEYLTCGPMTDNSCTMDICENDVNGRMREGAGNCRGYWICVNGVSQARCCAKDERFNGSMYGCVRMSAEDKCNDSCLGDSIDVQNTTLTPCRKYAIANKPDQYLESVWVLGMVERQCAGGTYFDQGKCDCVQYDSQVRRPVCRPELDLTFVGTVRDKANNNYIDNKNVEAYDGVAHFNGENSRLDIPRFNNIEHAATVVIRMRYKSTATVFSASQTLFSNGNCGTDPSIEITENKQKVTFVAGTTTGVATTSIDQPIDAVNGERELQYKFAKRKLSGRMNGVLSTKETDNKYLENVQCDLSIGYSIHAGYFRGNISAFQIYLCDPLTNVFTNRAS